MPGLRVAALLSALAVVPVGVPTLPPPTAEVSMPQLFDPARSQARFKVRMRILPGTTGEFLDVRGALLDEAGKQRVEVEVDGRKLRISGPAWMARVTRSEQFLAVDQHPQIRFRSDAFAPALLREGGQLRGELTLRGLTKPVAFNVAPATCATPGRDCEIVVTGRVSRQAFGMHAYRLTVRDSVDFEFQVRLKPEPAP
jgi:polyisoprenoid-binding protein YceI